MKAEIERLQKEADAMLTGLTGDNIIGTGSKPVNAHHRRLSPASRLTAKSYSYTGKTTVEKKKMVTYGESKFGGSGSIGTVRMWPAIDMKNIDITVGPSFTGRSIQIRNL